MARKTVYLGSALKSRVDTRGPERPSWPDIDILGQQAQAGVDQLRDAFALALAAETDWDAVRVSFTGGDQAPELLIPGRLLFVPRGTSVCKVEPVFPAPRTRLYAAGPLLSGDYEPALPSGVSITVDDPLDASITNRSGHAITVYRWTGAGFDGGAVVADNGGITTIAPGNGADRVCDFTVDKRWNLADLIRVGKIKRTGGAAETRTLFVSKFARDMHGNPGDPTNPTALVYVGPTASTGGGRFAEMSQQFFGRLAIDVFISSPATEPEGHPYRPRLAPERWITFGQIAVAATAGAPAAPDQAVLTFPVVNSKSVEFLCHNAGGADLYLLLVSPTPDDSIEGVGGVPNVEDPPAVQWLTVAPGKWGSLVIEDVRHPFAKILVGAAAGGTTIASGAVLTVKREVIE